MWSLALQTLAASSVTLTPEEPATLELALVGVGTLAIYAILRGRRSRGTAAAESTATHRRLPVLGAGEEVAARRAA
jgi:PEP-CTERM motif